MAQSETPSPPSSLQGDLWGGVSAMLVALPSSIAYGVTIVAVLGPAHLAQGALAGVIGAVALGITAACLGSARSLISAPCAPAAAILTALGVSLVAQAHPGQDEATVATRVLLLTTLVGLFSGAIQIVFGVARGGPNRNRKLWQEPHLPGTPDQQSAPGKVARCPRRILPVCL